MEELNVCAIFNTQNKLIRRDSLKHGDYRVVSHVRGLYIGIHSEPPKMPSLQIHAVHIQYREVNISCLFDPIPGANNLRSTSNTKIMKQVLPAPLPPPPPPDAVAGQSTTPKKSRKPRLQRWNALSKRQILEAIPDLFDDTTSFS